MQVADFHCDFLAYLAEDPARTPFDPAAQASIPFLQQGGVQLQVFPIFTMTNLHSVHLGTKQWEIYDKLHPTFPLTPRLAIENSSSFCLEEEPLKQALDRLDTWHTKHPLAYISLTWNGENRFGGGVGSQEGLKNDGRELLQWMQGKQIAVDLSHASDRLAEEILQEIQPLHIVPIASHSNFRAVCDHPRNLPDHLAQAIATCGGVIGLNLVRHFLGTHGPQDLIAHLRYAQKLGLTSHLCLGADFFSELDVLPERAYLKPFFFEGFSTSACYPKLRQLLAEHVSEEVIENLMFNRLKMFLNSELVAKFQRPPKLPF